MMKIFGLFIFVLSIVLFFVILKKQRKYLSLFVIIITLFLPKINILKISSGTATGLRTEDLIIFLFMIVICFKEQFKSCYKLFDLKVFKLFYLYILLSVISSFIGVSSGYTYSYSLSIFSLIRKVEYFCYIFVGYDLIYQLKGCLKETLVRWLDRFMIYTTMFVALQTTKFIGCWRFGSYDYGSFVGRAVGTFNGPYEIAAFMLMTMVIYLYQWLKGNDSIKSLVYSILSFLIIVLSQSRTSLLIAFVLIVLMIAKYASSKFKKIFFIFGTGLGVTLLAFILFGNISFFARFKTISFSGLMAPIKYYLKNGSYDDYIYTLLNEDTVWLERYVFQTGDLSFNIRMFKWFAMFDVITKFPLFGYGFGANSVIDGNYVKMLAENGFIGTFVFILMLFVVIKEIDDKDNRNLYIWMLVSVLLGSVLIDLFDASKIMEFLYFFIGISVYNSQKENCVYDQNTAYCFSFKRRWCRNITL